jgi:hypothetical protein
MVRSDYNKDVNLRKNIRPEKSGVKGTLPQVCISLRGREVVTLPAVTI